MRTKFSLGLGFTKDTKVTPVSGEVPFVSTPNELRELVETGKVSGGLKNVEVAKSAEAAKLRKSVAKVKTPSHTKRETLKKETLKQEALKRETLRGITRSAEVTKSASDGFRRTAKSELGGNFYTPNEERVKSATAPVILVSRSKAGEQSRFKKSAISLFNNIARAAGKLSSANSAALNQARIDFYSSNEKIPCTDYVHLFDKEDKRSVEEQKEICSACPLIDKCLRMALLGDELFGVWGGLDPNERRAVKRKSMRIRRSNAMGSNNV